MHLDTASGLLKNLNPEQMAAVSLPSESALILAGAGSGKTRVLTTRIAWLMQTGQVSPAGVMAVTFTNKAAKEMLTRLSAMLPIPARGMWIGTFHGLCNRFLRTHWKIANLPQSFQILDTGDQLSAVKRVCKVLNVDDTRYPPKASTWFIAGRKDAGLRPADVPIKSDADRVLVGIYQAYEDQCQREGAVDFAELLLRTYELMRDHTALREHYQRRFSHILVDEFQDTNQLQYAWLKMFAGVPRLNKDLKSAAVMAVGDDDQSIYAFRGAQVGNMASFEREFGVNHLIKLERNYRSFSNILDAANELIAHNENRLGKNLITEAGPGEPIRIFEASSDFAEAKWMLEETQALNQEGVARDQIAYLYRSNAQSRILESALFNAGIPYKVYGGLRFFERAEVKHALAYLRLIENPLDDTSFLRVVNFPARGIGARSLELLQDEARLRSGSLMQSVDAMTGRAAANLQAFVVLIDTMRDATQGLTLRQIMEHILHASGLREFYVNDKEGKDRLENLDELINAAEAFVTQEGFGKDAVALPANDTSTPDTGLDIAPDAQTGEIMSPLAAFLTHASLEAGDNQAQTGQDAIQLMTIHAAKGLEFDAVFISGLEEGLFPHENSAADPKGLEEERRLMYVAITRARQRLYLSFSQTRMLHGQTRFNVKSRFVDELPEHCLKWITPKQSGFGSGFSRSYDDAWTSGQGLSGIVGVGRRVESFGNDPAATALRGAVAGFRQGQGVFHTKFGEGKIVTLEGKGDDARAHVKFNRHGLKWLALSMAKLTAVD
jgi:DNA helicase II / ATP-dependent DNA helicase PcrA